MFECEINTKIYLLTQKKNIFDILFIYISQQKVFFNKICLTTLLKLKYNETYFSKFSQKSKGKFMQKLWMSIQSNLENYYLDRHDSSRSKTLNI